MHCYQNFTDPIKSQKLEVVDRDSETQLQAAEKKINHLGNLKGLGAEKYIEICVFQIVAKTNDT